LTTASPSLPTSVFPALQGRDLVCSADSADHLRSLVAQIGIATEKERASLLFSDDFGPEEILRRLDKLCDYVIPADIRLPIRTVTLEQDSINRLTPFARKTLLQFHPVNRSTLAMSWLGNESTTILTANKTAANKLSGFIAMPPLRGGHDRFLADCGCNSHGYCMQMLIATTVISTGRTLLATPHKNLQGSQAT
jgi:hypothetical protein